MEETDLVLLQRFTQSGDGDAFSQIVGRYQNLVYSTCTRILADPTGAEDAAQECFLRLLRKADTVHASLAGWLHRCATDISIDEVRRRALRKNKEEVRSRMNASSNNESTWNDLAPHLDNALEELPDDLRVVVVEHFLQRRTQAEVARELGVSAMTVSRRIDSGVSELRKKLKKAGVVVSSALLASLVAENAVCAAPAALGAALGKVALAGAVKASEVSAAAGATSAWVAKGTVAGALTAAAKVKIVAVVAAAVLAAGGVVAHKVTGNPGHDPAGNPVAARPEQPEAADRQAWITLLPRSPIRSINECYLNYRMRALVGGKLQIKSSELEIRSADNKRQAARLRNVMAPPEDLADKKRFPGGTCGGMELNRRQRRLIGDLPDGDYLVAVNLDGLRCSNVAPLKIDATFDSKKEPAVRLMPLPLGPDRTLHHVGLIVTGRDPADPELDNMVASFPELVVDGVERRLRGMTWVGPVGPLRPGQRRQTIIDLAQYNPDIAPKAQNTIKARVLAYESAVVTIPAKDFLGRAWDEATAHIEKLPPDVVVLRGLVTDPDGRPAVGYEVFLGGANGNFGERSGDDGRYEFVNVPSGEYQLGAHPAGKGQPEVLIKKVRIEADTTLVRDLSLERKFSFSGRATYEDGAPVVGREVMTTWPSPDGIAELNDFAVTDAGGRYRIGAPFEVASFVQGPGPSVRRNIHSGRDDVDFVVWRTWGEAVDGVQCRLRAEIPVWRAGNFLRLQAEVRNQGKHDFSVVRRQDFFELEFDGRPHNRAGRGPVAKSSPLGPGRHYKGIRFWLDTHWQEKQDGQPLRPAPGKHTVRVAFEAEPVGEDAGKPVRVVSNPVEIEIVPAAGEVHLNN